MFLILQLSTKNDININDNLLTHLIDKVITHEKVAMHNNICSVNMMHCFRNGIFLDSIRRNVYSYINTFKIIRN